MNLRIPLVILSCLVSVATGFVIASSRRGDVAGKASGKVVIGLSMDTLKEERWQSDRDLFVARAKALGAETLVQSANSDDARGFRGL